MCLIVILLAVLASIFRGFRAKNLVKIKIFTIINNILEQLFKINSLNLLVFMQCCHLMLHKSSFEIFFFLNKGILIDSIS